MNPDNITTPPSMDLPPVVHAEQLPAKEPSPVIASGGGERNPEIMPPTTPAAPSPPAAMPGPLPVVPPQPTNPMAQSSTTSDPVVGTTPGIADDTDLIEKEWVEKAKEIVNQTRDDPYRQNKALNKMKADYIKKRYSKDIQVDGE